MKKMRLAAYVIGAGMWWAPTAPAMAVVAGKVDSLSGSVFVSRNGADGGSLTLRGKTRLRIHAYAYAETEKTASSSWLSLLEGAMCSVTGAGGGEHARPQQTPQGQETENSGARTPG